MPKGRWDQHRAVFHQATCEIRNGRLVIKRDHAVVGREHVWIEANRLHVDLVDATTRLAAQLFADRRLFHAQGQRPIRLNARKILQGVCFRRGQSGGHDRDDLIRQLWRGQKGGHHAAAPGVHHHREAEAYRDGQKHAAGATELRAALMAKQFTGDTAHARNQATSEAFNHADHQRYQQQRRNGERQQSGDSQAHHKSGVLSAGAEDEHRCADEQQYPKRSA